MAGALVSVTLGEYGPAVEAAVEEMQKNHVVRRIWKKDHTLWKPSPDDIANRLGWLDSPGSMMGNIAEIQNFVNDVRTDGYTHALLLGMGGSSLAPEVFRKTFGVAEGYLDLSVLDSTDPGAILAAVEKLDLTRTLFIVSTKSGGTVETLSLFKYCYNRVQEKTGASNAGDQFIAITDPGSSLAATAEKYNFRKIFLNDPDVGGRYSALTFFGLVPAALIGMDIRRLLETAQTALATELTESEEFHKGVLSGIFLGAVLGETAKAGRDKVTFFFSPQIESFGAWIEQLIAESLGKEGKGILPVVGEPLGNPSVYGNDRIFIFIGLKDDPDDEKKLAGLAEAGYPVIHILLDDLYSLGCQCLIWELATAVAGHLLAVNPFDQPNVDTAKVLARQMISDYAQKGSLPDDKPLVSEKGITVFGDVQGRNLADILDAFFQQAKPGTYIALQAFIQPTRQTRTALLALQHHLRDKFKLAVTIGYGPRFLHSTGQLHKGDSGKGLFMQFTADSPGDLPIPDEAGEPGSAVTFGILKMAQVLGDGRALVTAGRKVIRFHLGADTVRGLTLLAENL
ncbi:MAG: glucose-6-phosphate isomerase [Deltaproteobacteria bacterium]|nr:glucose-6-phosphate isomerase [Deltaproteobacteria bacterium]